MRVLQWHIVTGMTGCANATQNASFFTPNENIVSAARVGGAREQLSGKLLPRRR